jgi:hypothetical protein
MFRIGMLPAMAGLCAASDTYTAAERRHWAFQPRAKAAPPATGNPIDAFLRSNGHRPTGAR